MKGTPFRKKYYMTTCEERAHFVTYDDHKYLVRSIRNTHRGMVQVSTWIAEAIVIKTGEKVEYSHRKKGTTSFSYHLWYMVTDREMAFIMSTAERHFATTEKKHDNNTCQYIGNSTRFAHS